MTAWQRRLALCVIGATLVVAGAFRLGAQASELRSFVGGSWPAITRASQGQPTIVHFWGLTCGPCRIEMPEWGKLLSQQPMLRLVTIHAERIPSEPRFVTEMLAASGLANAENWMFDDSFLEPLRFEIDPAWRGELPRTLLISVDGTMKIVSGTADIADVKAWIEQQRLLPRGGRDAGTVEAGKK